MKCPICKSKVAAGDPEMPFCSERCRLLDLGNWASEHYVIPAPITDPDELDRVLSLQQKKLDEA